MHRHTAPQGCEGDGPDTVAVGYFTTDVNGNICSDR